MADPTSSNHAPFRRRAVILGLLLAATLAFGAAARRVTAPVPTPPRITSGSGAVALTAGLDRSAVLRGSDGLVRVELVLRGGTGGAAQSARVPTDLVVVLDRSGSMEGPPIATARAALRELIAGLAEGDRFALVSYASDARIDIPLAAASAAARERWGAQIAAIAADGGTHMSGGLDLGHALLAEAGRAGTVGRLIVLSDGLANQGDYSLEGLRARAGRARESQYVVSAVGIGSGFDETVMSALADAGGGNFHYLPDATRLAGVFAGEFAAARETVARSVAVQIAPGAGVSVAAAGGYPLEPMNDLVTFRPGDLFAGQERRVWLTLRAPTTSIGDVPLGGVAVEFTSADGELHRVELAALPALACAANDADYRASFDAKRYLLANRTDALGELKQSVARKMAAGRQAAAVAEVDAYRVRAELERSKDLGHVDREESFALDSLRNQVSAPAAAAPEVSKRLAKELLERGRDDQRAGAKR